MDSSPLWRRIAFAAVVCVLAALGAYLIGPVAHRSSRTPRPDPAAVSTPRPSAVPTTAAPASAGQPDIYQWLPFTPAGLAAAAAIVTRFADAYGTYSYIQSASAYGGTLQPVTSASLVQQIEAAYSAPGVASARAGRKQVAVGTAAIASLSAFGPTSITFIVQIAQRITATTGASQVSTNYSVTLTGGGTTWQVTSVELASVGNS